MACREVDAKEILRQNHLAGDLQKNKSAGLLRPEKASSPAITFF